MQQERSTVSRKSRRTTASSSTAASVSYSINIIANHSGTIKCTNYYKSVLIYCRIPQNSPKQTVSTSSVNVEKGSESPSAGQNLTQPLFSNEDSNLKNYMVLNESGRVSLPLDLLEEPRIVETQQQTLKENSSQLIEKLRASADLFTAEYAPSSDLLTEKELHVSKK